MAAGDWIHKEAWWQYHSEKTHIENAGFAQWLNQHCEDGWEVLKISRNFGNYSNLPTWVVFRKQVE